jgi:Fic family protein
MNNTLNKLPPQKNGKLINLESKEIMKETIKAHRFLAELKGYSDIIPNKNILISALTLNEAKYSSEIENIITTHDELFKALSSKKEAKDMPKEVINYHKAIWHSYQLIKENGILTTNMIVEIQQIVKQNNAGIRKQMGTVLKNDKTGEVIYTPPGNEEIIRSLMKDLEDYMNKESDVDPLIKMAVAHYQFEAIHPFYDGNGRTGRIINVLYLVMKDLLDSPILYLSKYILENRSKYYKNLQSVTEENDWESWIIYILKGIQNTSKDSIKLLTRINDLINKTTEIIEAHPKNLYSKKLIDLIFKKVYTKISDVEEHLDVTRKTASKHLNILVDVNILKVEKVGRSKIFINYKLKDILCEN